MVFVKDKISQPRSLRLPIDRVVLEGELTVPQDARGLVVFANGSGSSRHSSRQQVVARTHCEAGMGTLLLDLLTPEEEAVDQVTQRLRFDIPLLARRLVKATGWLREQAEVRHLRAGYFGSLTGAAVALAAAAELGSRIGAVVSRSGRIDLVSQALPAVQSSTLLIVGGRDDFLLRLNEEAFASLTCKKQMAVIPEATQKFTEPYALEASAALAAAWFKKTLQPQ